MARSSSTVSQRVFESLPKLKPSAQG